MRTAKPANGLRTSRHDLDRFASVMRASARSPACPLVFGGAPRSPSRGVATSPHLLAASRALPVPPLPPPHHYAPPPSNNTATLLSAVPLLPPCTLQYPSRISYKCRPVQSTQSTTRRLTSDYCNLFNFF